ncbi:MAG: FMN-binding protein [Rikenellaceae bacterium]
MKLKLLILTLALTLASTLITLAATRELLEDGTVVIDTTDIAEDITGYGDSTPLKVYIKDGVIKSIEYLKNNETQMFFEEAIEALTPKWIGKRVEMAANEYVDVVSGATYSSQAVIETLQRAMQYEINAD